MITIWKKINEDTYQLVEELQDDLALAQRLEDLRKSGESYRAEKKDNIGSTILED